MSLIKRLCLLSLVSAYSPVSADPANFKPSISKIIDSYNKSCHAEQPEFPSIDEDPIESSAMLVSLDPINVYDIQIDEAGTVATVLYPEFRCQNVGYGWCGTGGCGFYLVVDDKIFKREGGFQPQSATISGPDGNQTVVVFGIHGGGCEDADGRGGAGVDPCYGVAVWNEHIQTFFSRDGAIKAWLPE
jgi:hypothetical protein